MFVIYLPAVGGEEGPGELEQCITEPRQPTALNKTRLPFNQPGVALLSQSGHLSPPQFTLELFLAADEQEPLPCEDGQAQPTRDNPAPESALISATPCLSWKDTQQVREIWGKVVDPLFFTKNALLGKKDTLARGRMWSKELFHHTRGTSCLRGHSGTEQPKSSALSQEQHRQQLPPSSSLPRVTGAWRVFKTQSNFLLEAVDKSAEKLENPLCFRDGCCKIM